MPPKSHPSLLPPQKSDVYNPFIDKRQKNTHEGIHWPLSNAGLPAIVEDFDIPQIFKPTGHPSKHGCCAFIPTTTKNEIIENSIAISASLGLRTDVSEECCSIPCVAPAKNENITTEHLADLIDVFKRRLEKQKRALFPERYATSEVESLLQELEQLREEEMTLLEEVRHTQWKCDAEEWKAGTREETDIYFSFTVLRDSPPVSPTKSDLHRQESIRRAEARKARKAKAERKAKKRKSRLGKKEEVRIHIPLIKRRWSKPAVPMEDVVWEEKKDSPEWWIPEPERLSPLIPPQGFGLGLEEAVTYGLESLDAELAGKECA